MAAKVAINGFGRIGRLVFRIGYNDPDLEFVAINDISSPENLAYLLKYDTVYGKFDGEIYAEGDFLVVNGKKIKVFKEYDPEKLPWKDLAVDIVVESTGKFRDREGATKHLKAGAKKVFISAPAKQPDITFVIGINEKEYDKDKHHIISIGSCTTNGLASVVKVLHENFGIAQGFMTTIHSYTNDQAIIDSPHKDFRRGRSAAMSMIPTTTGAAKMITVIFPELQGKFDGVAVRVPTVCGSLIDLTVTLKQNATVDDVNLAMKRASETTLKGILEYSTDPIVSTDILGNSHSSIFDSPFTMQLENKMFKIFTWYDNEWGFSTRMVDALKMLL